MLSSSDDLRYSSFAIHKWFAQLGFPVNICQVILLNVGLKIPLLIRVLTQLSNTRLPSPSRDQELRCIRQGTLYRNNLELRLFNYLLFTKQKEGRDSQTYE